MKIALLLLGLVLFAGAASALPANQNQLYTDYYGTGVAGAPNSYPTWNLNINGPGTVSASFDAARYDSRASLGPAVSITTIHIGPQYLVDEDTAGVWNYQASIDGTNIAGCSWQVETYNAGGLLATTYIPYNFEIVCSINAPSFGTHTFAITQTTASGTPDTVLRGTTTVWAERTDYPILGDSSLAAAIAALSTQETTHYNSLTALINGFNASELARYNAISFALTGFNATELQRAMAILFAIQDNATMLNSTLEIIYNEIIEHRENSLELTSMNDFNGMGFDGFLINCLLLTIYAAMFIWAERTRTMVLYLATIIYGALLAIAINNELGNSVVLVLLASIVYLIFKMKDAKSEMGE